MCVYRSNLSLSYLGEKIAEFVDLLLQRSVLLLVLGLGDGRGDLANLSVHADVRDNATAKAVVWLSGGYTIAMPHYDELHNTYRPQVDAKLLLCPRDLR